MQRRTFKHILNIPQLGEIVHIIWMLERWRKNDDDDDDDDLDHMSNDVSQWRRNTTPPPLSPLIKGHLKYPKPCYILKVLLEIN